MFPRQNQNNGRKTKDVQKEVEAENKKNTAREKLINSIISTGNENAGKILLDADESGEDLFGFFNDPGKDVKQAPAEKTEEKKQPAAKISDPDESGDDLFGAFDDLGKDVKQAPADKKEEKKERAPLKIIYDDSDSESDDDDLFGGVAKEAKKEAKKEYGKKDPAKALFPGDVPMKPQFYQDPANPGERLEFQGNADDIINEKLLDNSDDLSMRPMGGRKQKKDSWRFARAQKKKKGNSDLPRANQTQQRIAGLDITVQKLDKRNKAGRFKRFLTNLAIGAGSTIGAALNWLGAAFKRLINSDYNKMYERGQSRKKTIPEIVQDKRRHDLIPGWNGETFEKGPDGQDDILADFRRIPTVWSALTAGQAEDKNGKPLAPKISIYIRQGKEAEDQSVHGTDPGHAGLGIEYSRYSLRTNRYERYNLRYGFYPGSQDTMQGSLALTGSARIPGKLQNEISKKYTVKRSYPASARQVNAILKASEVYADKGYNALNRNCTTFVKDMIRNEAGIPAGDTIFEQERPGFSSMINFGIFAAKSSANTSKASVEQRFARLGTDKDLSYGGDGNMRVTRQDYRQYKESLENSNGGYVTTADLPNAAAENMRRMEGQDAGIIGSRDYFGTARVDRDNDEENSSSGSSDDGGGKSPEMNAANIRGAIINESNSLIRSILSVTKKSTIADLTRTPGIDPAVAAILGQIRDYAKPLESVGVINNDPNRLRAARSMLDKQISDMNTLLFGFFKNDARLHLPVMHMISLLEYGGRVVDLAYEKADIGKNVGGDLGNIRQKMGTQLEINYTKSDPKNPGKKKRVAAKLTSSRYEAYLQIYKSPDKAIDAASRFQELKLKDRRTKAEESEYQKLLRIDNLARDYDKSHNYMLEKNSYSQQDVDYAYSLEKMEKKVEANGPLSNVPASGVYKSLIYEKIFGGVTQRVENDFTVEEIKNNGNLKTWLDNDMCTCIQRRPEEMKTVIRGLKKAKPELTQDELLKELLHEIKVSWIGNVFNLRNSNLLRDKQNPLKFAGELVPKAFVAIIKGSELRKKLQEFIKQVFISDLDSGNVIINFD